MAASKKDLNPFADDEPGRVAEPPPDAVEVALDSEESEEHDEGDGEEEEIDKPSRKEKKRNRYRENIQAREAAEKALEAERAARAAEIAAKDAQVAQALAQARDALEFAKQNTIKATTQRVDPLDEEEAQADRERRLVYREYQQRQLDQKNPITPKELEEFETRAMAAEKKQSMVQFKRALREQPQPQQQVQGNPALEALRMQLAVQHPEIAASQEAQTYADGIYKTLIAQRKPADLNTLKDALDKTEQFFRYGKYKNADARTPDPTLRDKLQGPGRGAAAQGGEAPKSITMTKQLQQLADKAYSHIRDPKQRYEKWAKSVGAELIKEGVDLSKYG